jgi:hypothetical protein
VTFLRDCSTRLACTGMWSQRPLGADALARGKSQTIFKYVCNAWTASNMCPNRKSVQPGVGKASKKNLLPNWEMTSSRRMSLLERR